jgi:hypothetical protein
MTKKLSFTVNILLPCALLLAACAGGGSALKEDDAVLPPLGEIETVPAEDKTVNNRDNDIWYTLESTDQLNGEWEGAGILDVPATESKGFPETVFYVEVELICSQRDIRERITITFNKFLEDLLAAYSVSALTVDDLWERYFERSFAGYTLIKDEYALVIETSSPAETLFSDRNDKLYINQQKTRLLWFVKNKLLGGLLEPFGVTGYAGFTLEKR